MIRSRGFRSLVLASAGAVGGLGLAACSSSSPTGQSSSPTGQSSSPAGQSSSTTAAATGTPFKIAVLTTATGQGSSSIIDDIPVMKAWAAYVNSHGGIDGHDVQILTGDDQGTPSVGLSEAQKLVHDGVIAFVGGLSNDAFAWSTYVSSAQIPVIGGPAVASGFTPAEKYFYPSGTDYVSELGVMWDVVSKHLQTGRIFDAYCTEVPACATVPTVTAKAITDDHLNNLTLVYKAAISAAAPSYTSECLAAKSANANAVYIGDASNVAFQVLSQCHAQGFTPAYASDAENVYGVYVTDSSFNQSVGALDEFPWWDTSHPGVNTFLAAMQQSHVNWQGYPAAAVEAWASGEVFAAAVEAGHLGNNATPAQLAAALDTFSNQTVGGLIPPLTFTNGNRTVPCGYGYESLNGQWQYPTGLGNKLVCTSSSS
jgi:branched-chain amino acid transport system substrate-binding protein